MVIIRRVHKLKYLQHNIIFFIILIFLSSCASIINKKEQILSIYSNEDSTKVQVNNNIYDLPVEVKVKRSKKDLPIKLISETDSKDYILKPSINPEFVFGNLIWTGSAPLAYLIDFTNQKRFYYGKFIYLSSSDTTRIITTPLSKRYNKFLSRSYPTDKGLLNLIAAFPWVNNFIMQPENESTKNNTGFMGVSLGLEYFYSDTKFAAITTNAVSDFFIPFPAAVDFGGVWEFMNSVYLVLTNNQKYNNFQFGGGINFSKNIWMRRSYELEELPPSPRDNTTEVNYSIGLIFNGYYQITDIFFLGLIYRPNLLKVHPKTKFEYEHLISLEIRVNFKKFIL